MNEKKGMNEKEYRRRNEGILTVKLDKNLYMYLELFTCNILANYRDTYHRPVYRRIPTYLPEILTTVQSAEDHLTPNLTKF